MPSERDYAEHLREQAYKTLSPQIKDLEEGLKELSDSLSTGIHQIEQKIEAFNHIELPVNEVLDEIMEDVIRQKDQEEQSLVLFARDIRRIETQEEILGLLLDYAKRFFPRVALFTVRNDRFAGWSSRGFSEEAARNIADCSLLHSECPQFQEALVDEEIKTAPVATGIGPLSFLQAESAGAQRLVPLYAMQHPVALLYVEEAEDTSSNSNVLSILADLTVLRLENIALTILYALTEEKPATPSHTAPQKTAASLTESVPEPPAEVEQIEEAAEPEIEPETAEEAAPPTTDFEIPKEEEAIPSPAPPSAEPAPEASEQEAPALAAEGQKDSGIEPSREMRQAADEEKLHTEAKRFARLLVSEIKLYNENHVLEGRRNRDLYLRLKRDIDKSRDMYENRVSPSVSQKIDYFHDEIIRILGNNDPSTLGSDYPGPRVE
jgi:hypothetical protein